MNKKYISILVLVLVVIGSVFLIGIFTSPDRSEKDGDGSLITSTLQKVKVQAGWLLNGEFAQVCAAIVNGYYNDKGLDVEMIPGGPSGASFVIATNAVAIDNSLTLGIDGDLVPLLRGVANTDPTQRLKVKAFAAFWNENPYGFMVRADSGINGIKDFIKKKADGTKYKIGVTSDSVIQYAIAEYLGVSVNDLDLVIVGFDATPFLSKQVDILAGYWTTQAYELEKAGVSYKFISTSELPGFDQPSMIAIATDKTISEKKDVLVRWVEATNKGVAFIKDNPEKAAEYILDKRCGGPSFNKDQEEWLIKKSLPLFDVKKPGWISADQVTGFTKAYSTLGQIPRIPSLDELVDYSILDAVYK